jgi:hypothetical protein
MRRVEIVKQQLENEWKRNIGLREDIRSRKNKQNIGQDAQK